MPATFRVGVLDYVVDGTIGEFPTGYNATVQQARFHDDLGTTDADGTLLVVTVSHDRSWPDLVVALRFDPGPDSGFYPGVHLIPETHLAIIGAGTRLLAYDLRGPRRLWEDVADTGFWGWKRHGDTIVMAAELELAAWDLNANKLWSTFVEPPWDYDVREGRVHLDVMGNLSQFGLIKGPTKRGAG